MDGTVYNVLSRAAFAEAKAKGRFEGSADDGRDGFIAASLGARLRWEPSRGGAFFPHLYGPLGFAAVIWDEPLELGADGRHRLPASVLP